jgi:hypothetical protein
LLGGVRMFSTGVYKKFLEHLAAQAVFWQHPFYRSFDDGVGAAFEEGLGGLFLFAAGVAGEIDVDLVIQLVTCKDDPVGIDDDDEVAAVDVRGIICFVLAPQDGGNSGTHATDGLISTVHDIPVALNGSLVSMFCCEMQFAHYSDILR